MWTYCQWGHNILKKNNFIFQISDTGNCWMTWSCLEIKLLWAGSFFPFYKPEPFTEYTDFTMWATLNQEHQFIFLNKTFLIEGSCFYLIVVTSAQFFSAGCCLTVYSVILYNDLHRQINYCHDALLYYITGHGGNGFLKFQDSEEISNVELADAFEQMWQKRRWGTWKWWNRNDTCKVTSNRIILLLALISLGLSPPEDSLAV